MIMLFIFFAVSESNAAVSGSAETVSCSAPWGGVSGSCQMKKTVESVLLVNFDNWDRLTWRCQVRRALLSPVNSILVGSNVSTAVVPSRPVGSSWANTISVQTNEQQASTEYCTRNRSYFWYVNTPLSNFPIIGSNAVDITGCATTPNSGGAEDY